MNYGKTAYLKVIDLERKLLSLDQNQTNYNSCLELTKPKIDQSFTHSNPLKIEFEPFAPEAKNLCFQIKLTLSSSKQCSLNISLLVDGVTIHTETSNIAEGDNSVIVFKTYSPFSEEKLNLALLLESNEENCTLTAKSVNLVVLGASGSNIESDIEMRALEINDKKAIVSFADSNKLYYKNIDIGEQTLDLASFTSYKSAISHCFCPRQLESAELYLYRVSPEHRLYVEEFPNGEEILVCEDVESVFATTGPAGSDDINVIVYIKSDGNCYLRELRASAITNEKKINLPKGKYTSITAVHHKDSEEVFVLASSENGSNYILRSLVEVSTGNIVENLDGQYFLTFYKYIDMSKFKNTNEKLDLKMDFVLEAIYRYNQFLEEKGKDYLYLESNMTAQKYKYVRPILYGIVFDKTKYKTPNEWGTYTDDCAGFTPAYMDTENGVFIDNGWLDRWPFSELRPCLVRDDKVVGYLDKNDYSLFEDGSPADITDINSNVMIEFPKMYIKFCKEGDNPKMCLSNVAREGFTCEGFAMHGKEYDKIYISAYLIGDSSYSQEGMTSHAGFLVNSRKNGSIDTFCNNFKRRFKQNFEIINYQLVYTMQIMASLLLKSPKMYPEYSTGDLSIKSRRTGEFNQKGMYFGSSQETGNKMFGLENLFGVRYTVSLGLLYNSQHQLFHYDFYDPNLVLSSLSSDTKNYPVLQLERPLKESSDYVSYDIYGNNLLGTFCSTDQETLPYYVTTYGFSADQYVNTYSCHLGFGSDMDMYKATLFTTRIDKVNTSYPTAYRSVFYPPEE